MDINILENICFSTHLIQKKAQEAEERTKEEQLMFSLYPTIIFIYEIFLLLCFFALMTSFSFKSGMPSLFHHTAALRTLKSLILGSYLFDFSIPNFAMKLITLLAYLTVSPPIIIL